MTLTQTTIDRINREAEEKYSNKDIGYWREEFELNSKLQNAHIHAATHEATRAAKVIEAQREYIEFLELHFYDGVLTDYNKGKRMGLKDILANALEEYSK